MTKKLTKVAMTTALAAAAIVPAVVATPAQAAEAEVTFAKAYYTTANGTAAFEAGKLGSVISTTKDTNVTYVEGSNGEVFDMKTFSAYFAANKTATTNEVLTALSKAGKALSADQVKALNVKKGTVEDGKVVVDPTAVQKTALNEAIAKAEASPKAAELKDAIAAAKAVAAKADATQAEVDAAVKALNEAIAKAEAATELKVESVKAITTTKIQVTLSTEVDAVAAGNFTIAGLTVNTATLGEDKKTVTLTTNPVTPEKEYTVVVSGLKADAVVLPEATKTFTTPSVNELYNGTTLTYSDEDGILKANGADATLVTFTLKDAQGVEVTDAEDVVVSFTSTFGNFGEKRVTVQNGKATVMFTSESLTTVREAELVGTIVEAKDANLIGIKASAKITLDPNPEAGEEVTTGARVTEAEAAQADRVILYFNKEVTVEDYTKVDNVAKTRVLDDKKVSIDITENVTNELTGGNLVAIKGLLPVEGNKKALQVLLDVEANANNALNDNAKVKVEFVDKRGTVNVPSTLDFNLTDARKPELVRVDREGLKTIKVTFSEPVTNKSGVISAENLNNWSIDGKLLGDNVWGVLGQEATATVGTFDPYTLKDNRNVVTITLGKNASGDQIYFKPGTHSIQGANIGDWAAVTDQANNKMNTQTLDFLIPEDVDAPEATVEVQSPEQWLVTFNKDVNETAAQFAAKLKLQKYNTTTAAWADDTDVASYGITPSLADSNLNIVVTKVADNQFLVETDVDWTAVHKTETTNKNYYNYSYRLHLPAEAVTNGANGKKNIEQHLTLNGPMLTADIKSPEIASIIQTPGSAVGTSYQVTMSEPVKLSAGANTEGATDSQAQSNSLTPNSNWANIPTPTARFIKKDGSVTIPGVVATSFVAPQNGKDYERILTVTPNKELPAGDWILSVESISDDVGNTAATATTEFSVVRETVSTDFAVAWAYADKDASDYAKQNTAGTDGNKDAVYVKFTKPVKVTGGFASALNTANYTLNGKALPDGTQIIADIKGYDSYDNVTDSVTIILPDGTITDTETTVLNILSTIESVDGETVSNYGEKKLSFKFDSITLTNASTAAGDLAAFKAALADSKVREITLTDNITLTEDITIDRLVNINLGAFNITTASAENFKVETNETGRMIVTGTGTIGKLELNAPNAEFELGTGATVTTLTVTDLYGATLINKGTIGTLTVNDSTSVENTGTITAMTVAAGNTVAIDNAGTITTLTNNGTVKVDALGTIGTLEGTGKVETGSSISEKDKASLEAQLAQTAVDAEAAKITSAPAIKDGELELPVVADGYTVAIKSSSDTAVIKLDGTVTPPVADTTVNVVLTVTKDVNGTKYTADTASIAVVVPAKTLAVATAAELKVLTDAVTDATGKHTAATEGTASGEYAVGSKATLKTAIDAADAVAKTANVTKAAVDKAVSDLAAAVGIFEAGKVAPATAAELKVLTDAVTDATGKHTAATEGTASGEYAVGSKATLKTAIDAADAVAKTANVTKAAIDKAVSDLAAAVGIFEAGKVA